MHVIPVSAQYNLLALPHQYPVGLLYLLASALSTLHVLHATMCTCFKMSLTMLQESQLV